MKFLGRSQHEKASVDRTGHELASGTYLQTKPVCPGAPPAPLPVYPSLSAEPSSEELRVALRQGWVCPRWLSCSEGPPLSQRGDGARGQAARLEERRGGTVSNRRAISAFPTARPSQGPADHLQSDT